MPVQDLTPQLRTRLSRVERAVGWFVILATVLLLGGFGYYLYSTADRKGWFYTKVKYYTFVYSAAGMHEGDPVMLMGFPAGQITRITPMPPFSTPANVFIEFLVREPFFGYIWSDSKVKLVSSGLLGNRVLELVQGGTSGKPNLFESYKVDPKTGKILGVWDAKEGKHVPYTPDSKGYNLEQAEESPIITERLEELANQAQQALPGIFNLTNEVTRVLSNTVLLTAHADELLLQTRPLLSNLAVISTLVTNGQGSLGNWLIPTNLNAQLEQTLASAHTTLDSANTNVATLATSLNLTLENLANITSNLNVQVQTNDQILGQVSSAVVHADELVQGLKRHWLLRSAFKTPATNEPSQRPSQGRVRPTPDTPRTGKRLE